MEWWLIGSLLFLALIALLLTGLPVAFTLGFISVAAIVIWWGGVDGLAVVAGTAWAKTLDFLFVAIPLFVLMGEAIFFTGISNRMFGATEKWLGRLPGGLAMSSIASATAFGAVTGFSPVTTAALGSIAVPEMLRRNYNKGLATGSIAGGAALAILIPPSILMILYGALAGVSIKNLFFGGVIPGLLLSILFMSYVGIRVATNPSLAPGREAAAGWKERVAVLRFLLPVLALMVLVLGVIWAGVATPSESAGVGAFGALLLAIIYRKLNWQNLRAALSKTVETTSMLLLILVGATLFSQVLAVIGFTRELSQLVASLEISRWWVLILMQLVIMVMGCFMDPGSILFITMPIFLPVIDILGFDPLWFGILMMTNLELATITPPVGLNLYVMKSVAPPEVSMGDIFKGVLPFAALHVLGLGLLMVFPQLALWLPSLIKD
jgi:tripartite ATP-independent transporter DctM subunit